MIAIGLSIAGGLLMLFGVIVVVSAHNQPTQPGIDEVGGAVMEQTGWLLIVGGFLAQCIIWT